MKQPKKGPQVDRKLNDKQEAFVSEYLLDLNATKAAIRAGYAAQTARQQGSRLLSHVDISRRITEKKAERNTRLELNGDMVVDEIRHLAFARLHEFYELVPGRKTPTVRLKPFDKLTDAQRAAIKVILNTKVGLAVELYEKDHSLELLGKHLGIFEKHQQQGAAVFNVVDYSKAETPGYDASGKPTPSGKSAK